MLRLEMRLLLNLTVVTSRLARLVTGFKAFTGKVLGGANALPGRHHYWLKFQGFLAENYVGCSISAP